MACLFVLNAYVCSRLWLAAYIDRMGSVEGSFLALSRFAMRHGGDLLWFPAWFCGMPFFQAYQPGLHVTVAAVATALDLSPPRAYHLVTACLYSLGPVTLFWLCDRLTGRRGYALTVALVYSLFSPSVLLSGILRNDVGGWFLARRYQALVDYGEGPHIAALALLPLVIWSLDRAISQSRRIFIPCSALLLGALVVTNWPGAVGLSMALVAYFASRLGAIQPAGWLTALGIGILAYLLVCPWLPPSIVATVPRNAQASDATHFGAGHVLALAAFLAALGVLHAVFERGRMDRNLRFFLYFFLCSGFVVLGKLWGNVALLPQPVRFHLEMEMAFIGAAVFALGWLWNRLRGPFRIGGIGIGIALCLFQLRGYHQDAVSRTRPIEITGTIEYRMAKWFEEHLADQRVFAPGSVSVWMNAFVDTPQMVGCCGQSVPALEQNIAFFTIYSDMNAGNRAAEISQLWLKAYGVGAIGVTGPRSTEFYKPFANPNKFDGLLPVLWRDGDNVVYQIPRRSPSLAHVILAGQEVRRAPKNGLDVEPLVFYVAALDDPSLPVAEMQWLNSHEIRISTRMTAEQRISLQVSYAPGWHASANGTPVPLHADALGLTVIEPRCNGPCAIDLIYDGGPEAVWTRRAQVAGLILCVVWPLALKQQADRTS